MKQIRCVCGKDYWPNQAWVHKDHVANGVVNAPDVVNGVVNAKKDRHRKTAERAEYLKLKMREYRARKKIGIAYG